VWSNPFTCLRAPRVAPFLGTFKEYPPSQRPASFSVDQMVDALMKSFDQKPKAAKQERSGRRYADHCDVAWRIMASITGFVFSVVIETPGWRCAKTRNTSSAKP